MASRIKVTTEGVEVRGPLFEGRADPIMRKFFQDAKKLVAERGQQEIRQRVGQRAKHPTGAFAGSITTKDFAKGRTIQATYPPILYGPWLEGVSARNASTRFKGYRIFRLTRGRLRKQVGSLIQDLLRNAVRQIQGGGP